ncbi:MAG: LysM peptidoglycan-binding domain-containing protein [Deferribacterales bacterium]
MKKYLIYIPSFLALAACAPSTASLSPAGPAVPTKIQNEEVVLQDSGYGANGFSEVEESRFVARLEEDGIDIYNVLRKQTDYHLDQSDTEYGKYDTIPLTEDDRFEFYVRMFSDKFSTTFQKWLNRSNQYIYIVRDIFRREGVPEDLTYLPFTESGFNPSITSHAGACGMWQFMKGTGKLYGLDYNFWVDERRDFEKASVAAARHLRDLYNRLGDWYLALAAYNAGQGKIQRAIQRYGTTDFYELSKRQNTYLRVETKDYVPKFLALRYLARNYQEYGFDTPNGMPVLFDRVDLYRQSNLYVIADLINTDIDTLRELNPELMTPMTPPVDVYTLRIPYGKRADLEEKLEHITDEELAQFYVVKTSGTTDLSNIASEYGLSTSTLKKANGFTVNRVPGGTVLFVPIPDVYDDELNVAFASELKRYNPKFHNVRRGENMSVIAAKYGLSTYELMAMNKNVNPRRLRPGQSLVISENYYADRSQRVAISKPLKSQSRQYVTTTHKVKAGETLWRIATKYGTTVANIRSANNIKGNQINSGQVLTVPASSSVAAKASSKGKVTKYKVKSGDNLWAIAKKFGTSIDDIKKRNGVGKGIRPGMVLYID